MTDFIKPSSIDETLEAGCRDGAEYLAGGTWLNRRPPPPVMVSLDDLGLDYIRRDGETLHLGCMVRFQDLVEYEGLPTALSLAAGMTVSRTRRNMMTLGGEVALHQVDSCLIPALITLGASVVCRSRSGAASEVIALEEYACREDTGLIIEIVIPDDGLVSGIQCLSRTDHSRKSLVCAVAACGALRIVAGDCVSPPVRLTGTEAALTEMTAVKKAEIEDLVAREFHPASDYHAGADYKRYSAGVYVSDMLQGLVALQVTK